MTVMVGKLISIGGQPFGGEGHAVRIYSRITRTALEDQAVILQLIDRIEMPGKEDGGDGTFTTADMDPGPIRVELEGSSRHGEGWDINLPYPDPDDPQPWSLGSLIDLQADWDPPVVSRAEAAAREAARQAETAGGHAGVAAAHRKHMDEVVYDVLHHAADMVRGEVKDDADRAETSSKYVEGVVADGAAAVRAEVKDDADRSEKQAGLARQDRTAAEKAAGTAAADAVQKVDEKMSGYVSSAARDAGRAETARQGAETIQQGIPTKIDQELETKLPGELATRVPAELGKHLPGELDERVPPLVAESIADDRAVADAAAAAAGPAVEEAADDIRWKRRDLVQGEDLNTITTPGSYGIPTYSIANSLLNKPENTGDLIPIQAANLTVTASGGGGVHQRWQKISSVGQDQVTMERSMHFNGEWHPWREPWGINELREEIKDAVTPTPQDPPAKIDMLRQASRLRRGGVVGLSGRTPVALSFDHGFKNFRDLVLPELIRLGLPCTVAVNPDTFSSEQEGNMSWSQLQEWCLNHGVELAHHARSHGDVPDALTNLPALEHQILSTIAEAEDQAPEVVADAMIMPGVSGTKWQGFDAINDYQLWWEHPAGRMVLGNFPVVTWGMYGEAVPMIGQPIQGVDRIGLDATWQMNNARQKIEQCYGTGLGMSVFMHPVYLTTEGRPDIEELRSFLEWLASERDAGSLDVLTVSGFAYADPYQHRRLDLAPEGQWGDNTYTVEVDPLLNWAQGAQVVLETTADTSGTWTLSASSDVGGLDAVHRITGVEVGDRLRLVFSIPRTAKSITLHAYGTDRSCRVV